MIISLHLPKSGGHSFLQVLQEHFKGSVNLDYNDIPINKSIGRRTIEAEQFKYNFKVDEMANIDCIHGHFLPYKYSTLLNHTDSIFITWVREPLERLASHFYFWKRVYDPDTAADLQKKVVEEDWTFEKFCFSDEMQNIYTQFLWKFPVQKFNFIGVVEFFDEDIKYFSKKYLDKDIDTIPNTNINEDKKDNYFDDEQMIRSLKQHHAKDYTIYEYALEQRQKRIQYM